MSMLRALEYFYGVNKEPRVRINLNNNFKPNNINNLNNTNIQKTVFSYLPNIGNISKALLNTSKDLAFEIKQFYLKNKRYIIPVAAISSYTGICLFLNNCNKYIESDILWSNWQQENIVSYSKANNSQINRNISQKKLIEQLLIEIQRRYVNYKNPLDFLLPISTFIKNIEKEKNTLIFYSKFYNFFTKIYALKLFPINTDNFLKIEQKKESLSFISDIFFEWLTVHNTERKTITF